MAAELIHNLPESTYHAATDSLSASGAKVLPLTQGLFAIVDADDYDALARFNWYAAKDHRTFYAGRGIRLPSGRWSSITMHRTLMPGHKYIDHINGNGLDNRRSNLRPATHAENMRNRRMGRNNTSGYVGVRWRPEKGRWETRIQVDGRKLRVGMYATAEEAARARDAAALEHHGPFARLNFPLENS